MISLVIMLRHLIIKKGFEENNDVVKQVGLENGVLVYDFANEMSSERKILGRVEGM